MKKNTALAIITISLFILGIFAFLVFATDIFRNIKTSYEETTKINLFYAGWFCDELYISFDNVYQIGESSEKFDYEQIKETLFNFVDACNISYTVNHTIYCEGKPEIIITFNESESFIIEYYTYDQLQFGNTVHYLDVDVLVSMIPDYTKNPVGVV